MKGESYGYYVYLFYHFVLHFITCADPVTYQYFKKGVKCYTHS